MSVTVIPAGLAALSLGLVVWQWLAARRFPLHQRTPNPAFTPAVSVLKPLRGCDAETEGCLRSWFTQDYPAPVQLLFCVAAADDPVCPVVERLLKQFPEAEARLVICPAMLGASAKVSKLAHLEQLAEHELLVISDADVWVPPDFLRHAVAPLKDSGVGLVNCFYQLANPRNLAMRCEAVAINADFWSQVLQSLTLKPMDFALGAVMLTRRANLREIGGLASLVNHLADDYELGRRISAKGHRIELSTVVVECRERILSWQDVWLHQLRWSRTIRVCQPAPYFFSILSNGTLWPLLLLATSHSTLALAFVALCLGLRMAAALHLQVRLTRNRAHLMYDWLVLVKDLMQVALWAAAFIGHEVTWRGRRYHVAKDGTLSPLG